MARRNNLSVNGLLRLNNRLLAIKLADHSPLMEQWEMTMQQDNRRGVLAGQDKDGSPMVPVKYRPKNWKVYGKNRKRDRGLKGFGPLASGLHGNMSRADYLKATGPPLAPRFGNSRVITNFATQHGRRNGRWFVEGAWLDVVSTYGVPFLNAHFTGRHRLPVRNLKGVRPDGMAKAKRQMQTWFRKLLRA